MDERIKHSHNVLMAMNDTQLGALVDLLNYYGPDTFRGLLAGMTMTRQQHYALPAPTLGEGEEDI